MVYQVKTVTIPVVTGTGFFVSGDGYIVTNEHVVQKCKQVRIRGEQPETIAKVIKTDAQLDLALLKTEVKPKKFANLRELNISHLELNEPVMVMGYPEKTVQTGRYQIAKATVTGLKGPTGEPKWIQFSDSVQHGNSGGPLLDEAGNVAGVVVGKATLYKVERQTGREELVGKSDIAIALPMLVEFLANHAVRYHLNPSQGYRMPGSVEQEARGYIVNVLCERPDLKH